MLFKMVRMPSREEALVGREKPLFTVASKHLVTGGPMLPPFPERTEQALVAMGCFWGAEKRFWSIPGVVTTMVGYAQGFTQNPTYAEVCTGKTGHAEVVRIVFEPARIPYVDLLRAFWESHDPTQGMRQGGDVGTQYRSGIYTYSDSQREAAETSKGAYGERLREAGIGPITTEILDATTFYYAEDYHQQYLAKNPDGYCGLGGTGVACPVGVLPR